MKELTKAEEQIMQILWDLKRALVNDILDKIPEPKPAYNTVSTIVRILEKKGFVDHKAYGRTHEYFPVISKDDYTEAYMGSIMKNYFSGSFKQLVSFFTDNKKVSVNDLEEMKKIMEQEIIKQKKTKK
jgi:BlaI family penicillinase repressor